MPKELASSSTSQGLKALGQRLLQIQELSVVDRAMVPLAMLLLVVVHHMLWWGHALYATNASELIDASVVRLVVQVEMLQVVLVLALFSLGMWLRQHRPDALWFQHLTANTYGVALCWGGYVAGALNFASGVVLMSAPMVGFILLDMVVVKRAFVVALVTMLGFSFAGAYGWLPYAPVMQAAEQIDSRLFWTHSLLSFALPHWIPNSLLVAWVVYRWKQREASVLRLSLTDALTQVHNRRSLLSLLDKELARVQRHRTPLGVVLLDVDHFKAINDQHGHPVGDRVLQQVALSLSACLRQCDAIGRIGGEEFLILLPDTDEAGALRLAERCRVQLQNDGVRLPSGLQLAVTASFGVLGVAGGVRTGVSQVLHGADVALYAAKSAGRNRCESGELPEWLQPPQVPRSRAQWFGDALHRHGVRLSWVGLWQWLGHGLLWLQRQPQVFRQVLEWSILQRVSLVMGLHALLLSWYGLWVVAMVFWPDPQWRINVAVVQHSAPWLLGSIGFSLALMWLIQYLSQTRSRLVALEVFALVYFGVSLVGFGHLIGILSLVAGVNITCTPMMGLILFGPVLVATVSVLCMGLIMALAYAAAMHWVDYAPLLAIVGNQGALDYQLTEPFWVLSSYALSLPTMLVSFLLAEHVLGRWREREARLRSLSMTDELTGLPNRLRVQQVLGTEVARTLRHGPPMAVVLVDLDHFKSINDRWGHAVGDEVLRAASAVLASQVRACDVVGRYGGEEFMLVLPDTTLEGAMVLMERCRKGLEQIHVYAALGELVPVSGSIGIASNERCLELSVETMTHAADVALYHAKANGRNQIQIQQPHEDETVGQWSLSASGGWRDAQH